MPNLVLKQNLNSYRHAHENWILLDIRSENADVIVPKAALSDHPCSVAFDACSMQTPLCNTYQRTNDESVFLSGNSTTCYVARFEVPSSVRSISSRREIDTVPRNPTKTNQSTKELHRTIFWLPLLSPSLRIGAALPKNEVRSARIDGWMDSFFPTTTRGFSKKKYTLVVNRFRPSGFGVGH